MTKEERKEYDKKRYKLNKKVIAEQQKTYNASHTEERKSYNKQWRTENKEKLKKQKKKYNNKHKKERKNYLEKNKENFKEVRRKYYQTVKFKKYNITKEEYVELFNKQNGRCNICGTHQSELKIALAIDHDHVTKKIRGLLCMKCNRGIGFFNDNTNFLLKAIEHLK
jgi:hypothetical protein